MGADIRRNAASVRVLVAEPDQLGDGPRWEETSRRLYWLDIVGKRLSSCAEDGTDLQRMALPETPGSHVARSRGGRLIAFRRRIALFDSNDREESTIVTTSVDCSRERFNDGSCDAAGRFWVGTMDRSLKDPIGALYCLEADHSLRRCASGFGISNGIAWSPDYERLYQCDSLFPRIVVYPFNLERGSVGEGRVFASFLSGMGVPDGCAVDSYGRLWVAMPGVNRIICFDADGKLRESLETPTMWPSSVAFGGHDLKTLFITSLVPKTESTSPSSHMSEARTDASDVRSTPLDADGRVYTVALSIAGLPATMYGG